MSSTVHRVDFHSNNTILNRMMFSAGYVTSKMTPIPGPLFHRSNRVLEHFMSGVMRHQRFAPAPFPEDGRGYGKP